MPEPVIEVVCFGVSAAVMAQNAGADRIELCENIAEGGTTPSAGSILLARKRLSIALNIMIRPRGGDFLYDEQEFELMKEEIRFCKEAGVDGVVFGILTPEGKIDVERNRILTERSKPLSVTFHRAFDMTSHPVKAMEDCIRCGFDRILTSGQRPRAVEGAELLSDLIKRAGDRILIMPGGGVRKENILWLMEKTRAKEYHTSARKYIQSRMHFRNDTVKMGSENEDEYRILSLDEEELRELIHRVRKQDAMRL
ncbi:MAG: copper homeostasis protein CutC [Bacteroidia bacterium]|nr:copper homeostasis protein CutC [Bacteroidia bacterium]